MKVSNNLSYLFLCVPVLVAACTIETTGGSPSGEGGAASLGGKGGTAGAGGASTSSGGRGTTSEGGKTSAEGGSDANSTGGNIGGKPSGSGGKPSGTGGKASGSGGKPAEPPPVSGAAGNGDGLPEAGAPGDDPPATNPERFFFPTPNATNTVAPKVVVDAQGGVHAAYPAYFGGRAYYAYCKSNCSSATAFQVVELDVGSSIGNVSLALTPQGKPRLVLSEFDKAYYAACDAQCGTLAGWTMTPVFDHDNSMEVSGQALAIDTAGRVRFLMNTYVALLGIGQKPPRTMLASCDANCNDPTSWQTDVISEEIWQSPEMRIDAKGRTHVAAARVLFENGVPTQKLATYFTCDSGCSAPGAWSSVPLALLFEDTVVKPSLSLALNSKGGVGVALLIQDDDDTNPDGRYLAYAECGGACAREDWNAVLISDNRALRNGVSLAFDGSKPRVAFTLDYNIGVYRCDENCTDNDWQLGEVEFARNLPADDIFLFPGCSAGAWFLDSPSIAVDSQHAVRVGYRAYDVSGQTQPPIDPTKPRCKTGVDFTWTRFAALPAK